MSRFLRFALGLILVGVLFVAFSWPFGGRPVGFFSTRGAGESERIEHVLPDFQSVDINVETMNVELRAGDEFAISAVTYPRISDFSAEVEDGILTVRQTNQDRRAHINELEKLVITVPEDALSANTVNRIRNDVGNTTLRDLTVDHLDLQSAVGNIRLEDMRLNTLDIDGDIGNIDIENSVFQGDANIETEIGNIEIINSQGARFEADSDLGHVRIDEDANHGDFVVNLETSIGNITVR